MPAAAKRLPNPTSVASGPSDRTFQTHTGGPVVSDKKKSARSTGARGSKLLSDEERAAMKETLKERKRALSGAADGESDGLAKIAGKSGADRRTAKRLHA